ncbi:MAG: SDR family oxidoreductase [Chloroflexota bacterium]
MKNLVRFMMGAFIGLIGGYFLWRELREVRASKPFWAIVHKPGTALITGASSGIGAVFARRLAKKGYDLILVARREERLQELASELSHRYPTRCDVLAADLSTSEGIEQVAQTISNVDRLSLLINNAGFGTTGLFAEIRGDRQRDMVRVHIEACVRLTHAALPNMIREGYGGIINVSSIAAYFRPLRGANYCASKAYLNAFSEALQAELRGTGVKIQALCPGFTYTEFHYTPEFTQADRPTLPEIFWTTAEEVVDYSLAALGHSRVIVIPGLINRAAILAARLGFGALITLITQRVLHSSATSSNTHHQT